MPSHGEISNLPEDLRDVAEEYLCWLDTETEYKQKLRKDSLGDSDRVLRISGEESPIEEEAYIESDTYDSLLEYR